MKKLSVGESGGGVGGGEGMLAGLKPRSEGFEEMEELSDSCRDKWESEGLEETEFEERGGVILPGMTGFEEGESCGGNWEWEGLEGGEGMLAGLKPQSEGFEEMEELSDSCRDKWESEGLEETEFEEMGGVILPGMTGFEEGESCGGNWEWEGLEETEFKFEERGGVILPGMTGFEGREETSEYCRGGEELEETSVLERLRGLAAVSEFTLGTLEGSISPPLNSVSRFPYLASGADRAEDTTEAARARTARFM